MMALQLRLNQLGFWVGRETGDYNDRTVRGVTAAQKAAGLALTGTVGPSTATALSRGASLRPRTTRGRVLEVDRARQLLLVVDNGVVTRIYDIATSGNYAYWNPSTGNYDSAVTPSGTFQVTRQIEDWDPGDVGAIYRPRYLANGVALHGTSRDLTDAPESHRGIRLPLASMDELISANEISIGTPVVVY
ncbi:MAG: L,D-transpeptidase family protein [Propionibacteriaceae bacterium]|nr:L,D-transpeptidase family protein [Propionibacteriaceae bacterium]